MDAVLIDREFLAPDTLRELQVRRDGPSVRRLLAQSLVYFGSAVGLVLVEHPAAIAALVLVSGIVQFAMFGVLHESCHKTAFSRPWANSLAGWIAALAQPMSPALMRAFHFTHHRHTHELAHDPELGGLEMMTDWPRGLMVPLTMTGISFIVARVGWTLFAALAPPAADGLWSKVLPFVTPERRKKVAWEARVLTAIHAGIITCAVLWLPGLGWVYVGMMLGHMFLSWYVTCEHRGLPMEGTVLERTRSLITPAWLRWLVWNMPYHAEHHAWPAVPWHALPQLHERVREHVVHRVRPIHLHLHGGREP